VGKTCKIPPGQFREIKMAIFKIIKMKRKYELIEVLNAMFERCENAHDGEYYRKEFNNGYGMSRSSLLSIASASKVSLAR
jgi:hypothetical protein